MTLQAQIREWCVWASLMLALIALPSFAQKRQDQQRPAPRPNTQDRRQESRRESRPPSNREAPRREVQAPRLDNRSARPMRPAPQFQPEPAPQHGYRTYNPPTQGHHSGQWLNRQRELPPDQRKRVLESDPVFRRLPRENQQKYEQRLQRFNNMPPDRQQQVLRRMETWEHLTPQQKQEFGGIRSQFNNLPPDRRRAVHNAIDTLRAMPPTVRQREVESGRFSQFSPQERQILNDAARLPLAPAPQEPSTSAPEPQNGPENTRPQRYVPRPPR